MGWGLTGSAGKVTEGAQPTMKKRTLLKERFLGRGNQIGRKMGESA